jgi:hypothetical protein
MPASRLFRLIGGSLRRTIAALLTAHMVIACAGYRVPENDHQFVSVPYDIVGSSIASTVAGADHDLDLCTQGVTQASKAPGDCCDSSKSCIESSAGRQAGP